MTSLPLVIEGVVAILLFVTAGYCVVLERRMRLFRSSQESLLQLIIELDAATARADQAVRGLGTTTREAAEALDGRIREAKTLTRSLALLAAQPAKPEAHARDRRSARHHASGAAVAMAAARTQ